MAPTRAHTYLPVAPKRLTSGGIILRNGSRNSRFTEIPPCVTREICSFLRIHLSRAAGSYRKNKLRSERSNQARKSDEQTDEDARVER